MWKLIVICVILSAMDPTTAVKHAKKRYAGGRAGAYSGAGSYAGNDYDYDYGGGGFGYAPDFSFIDPFLFHQQLTAQIAAQNYAINRAIASTTSTGDATTFADASFSPDHMQIQQQIAKQHFDAIRRQSHYNNKGNKGNRYAPNFAAASGSVGPGGSYQTAYISPENADQPNVVNRFSASGGPGGYKGVSVSSFSSSSDIDGKKTSHRGSQTTINDNGKVTTYKVHS